ncbi:MAG: hypothetical protein PHQ32_06445 [Firmicutes bacterium]|nr:hypothetical protein [Bacillota bacterium]
MNKYDFARSKFLILISFVITFTLLYLLSYTKGLEILSINGNDYLTDESMAYNITLKSEKELTVIKDVMRDMDLVRIKGSNDLVLYYFNDKAEYGPDISWLKDRGKESSKGSSNSSIGIASYSIVLGKDLYKAYMDSKKDQYELVLKDGSVFCDVVGVLESGRFDFRDFSSFVLVDLDSSNLVDFSGVYSVEGDLSIFTSSLKDGGIDFSESDSKIASLSLSGSRFLSVQGIFGGIVLLLFLFTMVLVVRLWFFLYMKEAGVRVAFGGRRVGLLFYVLGKYVFVVCVGILVGVLSFFVYYWLFLSGIGFGSLVPSVIVGVVVVFGVSLLSAFVNFVIFSRKSMRDILES